MPRSATFTYDDPIAYQAGIRGGEVKVSVTAKGDFRGNLLQVDLHTLWMQSGRENLPRVIRATVDPKRAGLIFLADMAQPIWQWGGMELPSSEVVSLPPGSSFHFRSQMPCSWATMSLPPEILASASSALVGGELTARLDINFVHPDPAHMARPVRLHAAVRQLAVAAPDTLAHPEVAKALEHQLIHTMVSCLAHEKSKVGSGWRQHTVIINRFEEVLAANGDRPLHLAEICAAVGVSERTLRSCCEEHLGMGPIRYLWLRRMHLARLALLRADPAKTTVTQIATDLGFWELGRFSVAYQALFGEPPSASLRKPPDYHRAIQADPISFAASDFA